jgi:hypothetical protein
VRPVFFFHGFEFEPNSAARYGVPHDRICPDLPFLDKKMKADRNPRGPWFLRSDEKTSQADIVDA